LKGQENEISYLYEIIAWVFFVFVGGYHRLLYSERMLGASEI